MKQPFQPPYDLFSPQFKANPFPTFAHMREQSPIYAHQTPHGLTIWYVTRYEDVLAILKDNDHFCKDPRNTGIPKVAGSASRKTTTHRLINENMLFSDPPDHTRLRSLVSQAFTPQRVEELADFIHLCANRLIDGFQERGHIELIASYALPLPVYVICHLLGIPESDREQVALWSQAIISPGSRNLNYSERKLRVQALTKYLKELSESRTTSPADDLISALVRANEAGDHLSQTELSSMVALLLVTGHETTVNLIGNGALALLQNRDQLNRLYAEPHLWDSAIEELLRYDGPVETSTSRWARQDFDYQGNLIKQGDLVRVVLTSANRDQLQFTAPDKLRIDRPDNRHLAFGYGIHYCLGAPLARLEGKIALRTIFSRLVEVSLAGDNTDLHWRSGVLFRGLEQLPIRWEYSQAPVEN